MDAYQKFYRDHIESLKPQERDPFGDGRKVLSKKALKNTHIFCDLAWD